MLILFEKDLEPFILNLPGMGNSCVPPYPFKKFNSATWFDSDSRQEVEAVLKPALKVLGLTAKFAEIDSSGLMCFLE